MKSNKERGEEIRKSGKFFKKNAIVILSIIGAIVLTSSLSTIKAEVTPMGSANCSCSCQEVSTCCTDSCCNGCTGACSKGSVDCCTGATSLECKCVCNDSCCENCTCACPGCKGGESANP